MSSNLKVNTILPSTGTTIGIGTVGGLINVVGNIDVNSTSGISTFNGLEISGIVTAKAGAAVTYYGDGANLTNLAAANITGTLPAISGANLTNLPPSAPVGGASTNQVFFENHKAVEVGYQITSTKNAMSAGPISINAGIAVTVPSGCSWTIV